MKMIYIFKVISSCIGLNLAQLSWWYLKNYKLYRPMYFWKLETSDESFCEFFKDVNGINIDTIQYTCLK